MVISSPNTSLVGGVALVSNTSSLDCSFLLLNSEASSDPEGVLRAGKKWSSSSGLKILLLWLLTSDSPGM